MLKMIGAIIQRFSSFNLGYFLFFLIPSVVASFLNMHFGQLRPIDISSNVGSYIAFLITFGMLLRCYIAGFSVEQKDYEDGDSDKAIYVMVANLLIIIGFMLFIGGWVQVAILTPIAVYHLYFGIKNADGNFLLGEKASWSASACWRRELKIVVFVSVMAIVVQMLGFKNGAPIPIIALR